ncbi:MAG TPA: diacylglycerol kinase family protein [Myxococcales bacterium]|jgi:diacylglycerol kinase family enzyme|nr:diacylglycerol kinase family protein [Myxococcales bacterium]
MEASKMIGNVERLPVKSQHERVAILLNANAKAVSESLRRELESFVPPEDVYFSRSFEDARAIARTVLDRGYRTVLTGGGDGTFVGYANCILEEAARGGGNGRSQGGAALKLAPLARRLPRFGVLKLGTGNALAEFSGASSRRVGVVEDILRARSGEVAATHKLHLLEHEGKRAPFAGLGLDAAVLNDYVQVKSNLQTGNLRLAGMGGLGYFWAIAGRTIPRFLMERQVPNVEVVNLGAPAHQIGPDGVAIGRPIGRGEILYRGPCRIAAAGTVPCYGFGFRIFPHALRAPGRFQLRLTALSIPRLLASVPAIWRGQTPSGLLDFQCEKAAIRFDREMPLQVGGDAEGYRREVILSMSPEPIELLDFRSAARA